MLYMQIYNDQTRILTLNLTFKFMTKQSTRRIHFWQVDPYCSLTGKFADKPTVAAHVFYTDADASAGEM